MKNTLMKVLVLICSFAIVISMFVGCSTKKQEDKTESDLENGTQESQTTKETRKTIEYTIGGNGVFATGGVQDHELAKLIESKFGIRLNVIEGLHNKEKQSIALATGDLPDIFSVSNGEMLYGALTSGMIIDLTDMVTEETTPNVFKYGSTAIEVSKNFYSNGTGKLYAIPNKIATGVPNFYSFPHVRWDYYQEIGSPVINNFDELIDMIKQILALHPKNEAGEPYYGYGTETKGGFWSYGHGFASPFAGKMYLATPLYDYNIATKDFSNMITEEDGSIWLAAKYMNKLYRENLLNPDVFTLETNAFIEQLVSDRYICWWRVTGGGNVKKANKYFADNGIDTAMVPVRVGEDTAWAGSGWHEPAGSQGYLLTINKNCKEPERIIELVNYCYTIDGARNIYKGPQGITWDYDANGKAGYTDEYLELMKSDPEKTEELTNNGGFQNVFQCLNYSYKDEESGQYVDFSRDADQIAKTYNKYELEYCEKFGLTNLYEPMMKSKGYIMNTLISNMLTNDDTDIVRTNAQIQNILFTSIPEIVLKAKTDEEYKEMREDVLKEIDKVGYKEFEEHWAKKLEEAKALTAEMQK